MRRVAAFAVSASRGHAKRKMGGRMGEFRVMKGINTRFQIVYPYPAFIDVENC